LQRWYVKGQRDTKKNVTKTKFGAKNIAETICHHPDANEYPGKKAEKQTKFTIQIHCDVFVNLPIFFDCGIFKARFYTCKGQEWSNLLNGVTKKKKKTMHV
jgi:hypothetical protein